MSSLFDNFKNKLWCLSKKSIRALLNRAEIADKGSPKSSDSVFFLLVISMCWILGLTQKYIYFKNLTIDCLNWPGMNLSRVGFSGSRFYVIVEPWIATSKVFTIVVFTVIAATFHGPGTDVPACAVHVFSTERAQAASWVRTFSAASSFSKTVVMANWIFFITIWIFITRRSFTWFYSRNKN